MQVVAQYRAGLEQANHREYRLIRPFGQLLPCEEEKGLCERSSASSGLSFGVTTFASSWAKSCEKPAFCRTWLRSEPTFEDLMTLQATGQQFLDGAYGETIELIGLKTQGAWTHALTNGRERGCEPADEARSPLAWSRRIQ